MDDTIVSILVMITVSGYGIHRGLSQYIDKKFTLINKKLNALLDAEGIEYPKAEHISYKAKQAIKGGDRNKATELIIKETDCSKAQALALIEKLEKLQPF